jgi:putative colanic acid biosynthesis UDP-glucose lipid carrier transferase
MTEANLIVPISATTTSRDQRPIGNGMLNVIESILDPAVLIISLWIIVISIEGGFLPPYLILSIIVFALTFPGNSHLQSSFLGMCFDVLFSWFWVALLLIILGLATGYHVQFLNQTLITWLWVAPLSQISAHLLLRVSAPQLLKLQGPQRRAIIVGMNDQGVALARRVSESRYSKIEISGFFDDREEGRLRSDVSGKLLGKLSGLPQFVKDHHIQTIYLSLPIVSQPRILQLLDELKDTTASIYFLPDVFVTDLIQSRSGSVCGMPVISVCESPFTGYDGIVKRASDLILSLLILILVSPLLIIIAAAIKIDSPGPIIFKQRRYGLDGEEIVVYKFRSMRVCEDGGFIRQAQDGDDRITRLGAFLRKTSLDELPQFVNVLQGRMSIVGPRPHAVAHNEIYRNLIKGYMIRHKVKPGITGWAQVNGYRGETKTLDKMQGRIDYDLDYLRNWSLRLDLRIIMKTVLLVFKDSAAY